VSPSLRPRSRVGANRSGGARAGSGGTGSGRGEMPFLEHLEELRWRILKALVALAVGGAVGIGLVLQFEVLEILVAPVRPFLEGEKLLYFSPGTPFFITLKLGLVVGALLALPVIIYQVWAFFSPALEAHEKKVIVPSLYFGLALFMLGVFLAYRWVLPLALLFLTGFQQGSLEAAIEVGEYLGFVTRILLAFGAVFELPVVVMILSALGLITPAFMRNKRRHAIVGITILASLLTPGDLASTFLMMGPMIILYEVSILLSVMIYRKKAVREAAGEPPLRPSPEPPSGTMGFDG
jgi:sec-independent protein translocase protein TatC